MSSPMQDAMNHWLQKYSMEINTDTAHDICQQLNLTGEEYDACILAAVSLERGEINNDEFTVALADAAGKTPEEIMTVLSGKEIVSKADDEGDVDADTNI